MNEALDGLFTKLGYDRKKIWIISVAFWVLYVGAMVLAVFLSAWNMKSTLVAGIYIYLLFVALPLLFSPVLWGVVGTFLALAGQFGGEKGLSIKDATAALEQYGKPLLSKVAYALLVAMPVWFMAMVLLNTKGMELVCIFIIPFLPTTIYLCLKRWPDGETFTAVVRTVMLVIVLGVLAWGIINTFSRGVSDPEVQVLQDYRDEEAAKKSANLERQAKRLVQKLKNGTPLSPAEQELHQLLEKRASGASGASGIQGAAGKVRQVVEQAKPDDVTWWKSHWYIPAAAVLLLVLIIMLARKKTAVATTAGAAPKAAGSRIEIFSLTGWINILIGLVLFLVVGYLWYGGPGWYETVSIPVTTMKDRKVCLLKDLPSGKSLRYIVPNEERGAIRGRIEHTGTGASNDSDLAASMLIEKAGRNQSFRAVQCPWVSWAIEGGERIRVVDEVVIPVKFFVAHQSGAMNWLAEALAL